MLPIIAVLVAGVLPSTGLIRSGLLRHGLPERDAALARIWIEGSALLTGAIAVVLALVRIAAGFDTAFLVLLILGIGAAATAIWAKRRYAWWVAFACFTGALWCLWALADITVIEPYLLPPALALAIIGAIVTGRGGRGAGLYATGLAVATVPVLGILAVTGNGDDGIVGASRGVPSGCSPERGSCSCSAHSPAAATSRLAERFAAIRIPTLALAIAAGAAGPIQAVRYGLGRDQLELIGLPLLLVCLAFGATGAIVAAVGRTHRDRQRRIRIPPREDALAVRPGDRLPGRVCVARDAARNSTTGDDLDHVGAHARLPRVHGAHRPARPPAADDAAAGVAGVRDRVHHVDRRVEHARTARRVVLDAARRVPARRRRPRDARCRRARRCPRSRPRNSWPIGHTRLVAAARAGHRDDVPGVGPRDRHRTRPPGEPSWSSPLALVAILLGSQLKLAAPFFLGIIVLPIENIVVFAVQIGRDIESVPWWITLAIVGAVLLIIAVTYERRSGEDGSIAARLRDLK